VKCCNPGAACLRYLALAPTAQPAAMTSIASIALSGMNAAQVSLRTRGHNIANLGTQDFRREQVLQAEAVNGGTTTSVTRAAEAGHSLETDMVGQLQAKNAFLANLAVFKTSDRMAEALLDLRA
jgi:flagellar hook protein FlgE